MPEMVGNNVAVHNGKTFNIVEIKFDMIGRYLGEFSLTYKHTRHGKAGVGATKGSAHSSLKWWSSAIIITIAFISDMGFSYNLYLLNCLKQCKVLIPVKSFHKVFLSR